MSLRQHSFFIHTNWILGRDVGYLQYVSLIIFSFTAFCSISAVLRLSKTVPDSICPAFNVLLLFFHYLSHSCPLLSLFFPKAPLDQAGEMSLVLSGFEAGKKNFLQLTDKDGEQPQIASVSHDMSCLNTSSVIHRSVVPLSVNAMTVCRLLWLTFIHCTFQLSLYHLVILSFYRSFKHSIYRSFVRSVYLLLI